MGNNIQFLYIKYSCIYICFGVLFKAFIIYNFDQRVAKRIRQIKNKRYTVYDKCHDFKNASRM